MHVVEKLDGFQNLCIHALIPIAMNFFKYLCLFVCVCVYLKYLHLMFITPYDLAILPVLT